MNACHAIPLRAAVKSALPPLVRPAAVAMRSRGGCRSKSSKSSIAALLDAELFAMRIKEPYIEALRQQREQASGHKGDGGTQQVPAARDLSPKRMSDSYARTVLPLADNEWLSDKYLNVNGDIRLGKIIMDLDALAGVVSYRHTGEGVMVVTAAVDRIIIRNPLTELVNLEMSGNVTFATGRSSMEVSLQVAKAPAAGEAVKPDDVILTCAFTMVSLDPSTKRPVSVPALSVETDEERRLFEFGERNYHAKKAMSQATLRKTVPNEEESALIHSMWLQQLAYADRSVQVHKPDDVVYMDATRIHSTQIMQPQFRNRHNFVVFGGYLLQQTYELAFTCAAAFSHSRPIFVSLDPSTFQNPVPVGSVLYVSATVAYTEEATTATTATTAASTTGAEAEVEAITGGSASSSSTGDVYTRVQVRVDSSVRSVEHGEKKPTGQFNYTFLVKQNIKIMPRSYQEMMMWIDARRRTQSMQAIFDGQSQAKLSDQSIERRTE